MKLVNIDIRLIANLPYDVKYTLLKMFYGHTHFSGVPENAEDFVKFGIKTLKQGLFIPD
jgi:hypothetical protein